MAAPKQPFNIRRPLNTVPPRITLHPLSMAKSSIVVDVRQSRVGQGVFARRTFRNHQVIGEILGEVFDGAEYTSNYCMELAKNRTLEPVAPYRFLNHSCEPNCELFYYDVEEDGSLPKSLWLQAISAIPMGDELTIDYAWPADAAVPCQCGVSTCRGWIVDPEDLPAVLEQQEAVVVGNGR